ncbi:extracellular solute-binding protein [Devosia nitrariae]|uniref:LysR family transcriptional regulator n=1 Tax=Devosia nitrariae TaxID=2071872 RepID=A0ABQ5VZF8_9HYPH|nr:extracellular solute-binding protein [Devosia nitrariae]GLQ52891.1 LysR family transcriptional regulator [Devosia nitrariae]
MLRKLMTTTLACALMAGPAIAYDLTEMSWDEIVDEAKAEGELTWYVWYFQPEFRQAVKPFEEQYGIIVNIPDVSSGDDALNKVLAEAGRETGDIDIIALGGQAGNRIDVEAVFLGPILPLLPEADRLSDEAEGVNWQGYGVKYWGNQTGMAYDANRVDPETLPQTLADLEAWIEANPYQLGFNYENGGSGPSFIHNVARNVLGITPDSVVDEVPDLVSVYDWFNSREDKFGITASNADSLTRLNSGEFLIVPAWEDMLFGLIRKNEVGDHIEFYIPEWGMNGGGNVIAIPKNAPRKAAALLFAAWLTSAETQTALNGVFGSAPANTAADDSNALVPNDQRANSRVWSAPLSDRDVVPGFIENVVQD